MNVSITILYKRGVNNLALMKIRKFNLSKYNKKKIKLLQFIWLLNHSLSLKSESVSKISYNIVYLIIQLLNKDQFIKFKSIFNIGRKLHDILISLQCFLLHIGLIYKKTSFMIYPGNHHHFYNRNLYGQRCCQSKPAFLRSLTS